MTSNTADVYIMLYVPPKTYVGEVHVEIEVV